MTEPGLARLFLDFSRQKLFGQYVPRLRTCLESLSDDQLWWRPNDACNSVGNLLLHLNGNVRQWLVASFRRLPDDRDRPSEFHEKDRPSKAELLTRFNTTLDEASATLDSLTQADLESTYTIQGYTVSGLAAVYQVVEHFGLHYGQIVYITKMLRNADLGFYRELNQTGRLPGKSQHPRQVP